MRTASSMAARRRERAMGPRTRRAPTNTSRAVVRMNRINVNASLNHDRAIIGRSAEPSPSRIRRVGESTCNSRIVLTSVIGVNEPKPLALDGQPSCFYRIAQEALRNVQSHPVIVTLITEQPRTLPVVEDSGPGFDSGRWRIRFFAPAACGENRRDRGLPAPKTMPHFRRNSEANDFESGMRLPGPLRSRN